MSQVKKLLVFLNKNKIALIQAHLMLSAYESPVRISDVGKEFGTSSANMTNHVDTLEEKKLITRHVSEDDRREFRIHLTSKGINLVDKIMKTML